MILSFATIKRRRSPNRVTVIQRFHCNFYVSVAEIYRISAEARQLDYSLFTTHARMQTISNALRSSIDDVKLKILHTERYYQWVQVRHTESLCSLVLVSSKISGSDPQKEWSFREGPIVHHCTPLWISIRANDWIAERAIIASNENAPKTGAHICCTCTNVAHPLFTTHLLFVAQS